jgi:hypothetical protein
MASIFPDREPGPQLQYWAPREADMEMEIASAHMDESDALFEAGGMVQEHEALGAFRFIRGETLARFGRFPSYEEVADDLVERAEDGATPYFVSHRWLTQEHPDPNGRHFDLLRAIVQPSELCWIDYSCLPQGTAYADEVRKSLRWLMSLTIESQPLVIRTADDGYEQRAWCILETLAAQLIAGGRARRLLSEVDEKHIAEWEWSTLDRFLLDGGLPADAEVTVLSDLKPLQRAAKALMKMADVNLVHHYVRLGQMVSDTSEGRSPFEHYFANTPPYYLVARCDLTKLRRWTLSTCRSLGLDFSQFSSAYEFNEDSNAFVRMATRKEFHHNINIYELPPIATHSRQNLHWLATNRKSGDSRTNLFYILTNLLVPLEEAHRPGAKVPEEESKAEGLPPSFDSNEKIEAQVHHQSWGDRKRLSIEMNCPPGNPRPDELFDLVVYLTELRPDDFETSEITFGRQEFLVRPAADSVKRYLRSRRSIESRLRECYQHGLVRGASW